MPDPVPCREVKPAPLWMAVLLFVIPVLLWVVGWLSADDLGILGIKSRGKATAFMVTMVLMTLFCFLAGKAVTGLWRGLLIDSRNRISLSRFQTAVWTVVVLSAILVAAFSNVSVEAKNRTKIPRAPVEATAKARAGLGLPAGGPLDFPIPEELWLVMGISVTSLVGSPLLLAAKKERPASEREAGTTTRALQAHAETTLTNQGQVLVRNCPEEARWADLFQAEEVGNGAHLDLAKIQNFYFTLILVFAYANSLFTMFTDSKAVQQLPELSGGMVALLGISHAAYLANKARPHSETGNATDGAVNNADAGSRFQAARGLQPPAQPPAQ